MTATNSFRARPVHRRRVAVVALALAAFTSGVSGIYVAAETTPTSQPVAVTATPPPPAASAPAPVAAPPAVPATTKRKSPAATTTLKATSRKPAASAGDPADSPFCSKNPDLCTNGVPDKKSDRAVYQNDPRSNADINSDQPMYAPEGTCPGGYARIAGIC